MNFKTTRSICLLLVLAIAVSSCKKDDQPAPATGQEVSGPLYHGFLETGKLDFITGDSLMHINGGFSQALFLSTPIPSEDVLAGFDPNHPIFVSLSDAGVVTLNNKRLTCYSGSYSSTGSYSDSTGTVFASPYIWTVQGSSLTPNFSHAAKIQVPSYTGYASLPDTLKAGQPLTVTITGCGGADEINVVLISNQAKSKTADVATGAITFSSEETAAIGNSFGSASMYVRIRKAATHAYGNKLYKFYATYFLNKTLVVK